MTATRRFLALSAGIALAAALAGCASGASTAGSTSSSPSSSPSASAEELEFTAAWLNGGTTIGLVTNGSSTCVPTAESVELLDDGALAIELSDGEADKPCTMDLVPRVTLVEVPADVDPSQDLELQVSYGEASGDEDIEGVTAGEAPDEYGPSAGWTGEDDMFVILTWGSSTCVPLVETAEPTGPTQVTVTFATPPADQACTMDMVPRGTLAKVTGLEGEADIDLVLTGAEFSGASVRILGEN
ncbi:MAG TPA: hypothetical protein VFY91_08770 [Microbacterium sp.]|nr:hypothetical protein [Microbacterium sp.]